ncbi:putative transposase [Colletotrichum chrysophilum]|uniref:Transposase n=1 Tax=Colletotrichum chrysophilum TaxID=1836956 RepID=A0AAD9AWK7_9PEZI|nr:putative transposase [Colletotrichum chrysophilum]
MKQYTEDEVIQALNDITNGVSSRTASRRWGVPRSTLISRIKGHQPRQEAFQDLQRLWVDGFMRRNPSIKVQRSRSIDSRRVNGASTEVIRDWFKYLAMPRITAIKPANRYNMDETGILEGKGDNGLVLGRAATKSVRKSSLDHEPGYLSSSVSLLS